MLGVSGQGIDKYYRLSSGEPVKSKCIVSGDWL